MKWIAIIAVLMITITGFAQVKQIGVWVEYVDYDGEYVNILEALEAADFDYELHEFWDHTDITDDSLREISVFIQPELESGGYSMGRPAGLYLSSILHPWVESGGLLIAMYSHGKDFICGAGFDSIGGSSGYTSGAALTVVLPTHPLAEGVATTFSGMNASNAYSYYGDYTPVVTYSSTYMHTGFQEFGSGAVVFFGWDYYAASTPNQDRLFVNAMEVWGMMSEGPIVQGFFPPEGSFVSVDTPIVIAFADDDGIDLSSFEVEINGVTYTGASPAVSLAGDSVIIDVTGLSDGDVELSIISVEDVLGHAGPDTSEPFIFYVDKTPPALLMDYPSGHLTYIPNGSEIRFRDSMSGSGHANWFITMNGADSITMDYPEILMQDDSLLFVMFDYSDAIITPMDTNWIEFTVWDSPDVGSPNDSTYRWWFYPDATWMAESEIPREIGLSVWPNPFNRACRISAPIGSRITIFNQTGRIVAELPPDSPIWQPSDGLGCGVYLIKSDIDNTVFTEKVIYLK